MMDLDKTLVFFDSLSSPSSLLMELPHGWDPSTVPCPASTGYFSGGTGDGVQCLIPPAGFIFPFCATPETQTVKYTQRPWPGWSTVAQLVSPRTCTTLSGQTRSIVGEASKITFITFNCTLPSSVSHLFKMVLLSPIMGCFD